MADLYLNPFTLRGKNGPAKPCRIRFLLAIQQRISQANRGQCAGVAKRSNAPDSSSPFLFLSKKKKSVGGTLKGNKKKNVASPEKIGWGNLVA
ncbi:Uncharacterised protein [uncultured archaeon]|nr:Uncharacterised protein [uncultured archaeon]